MCKNFKRLLRREKAAVEPKTKPDAAAPAKQSPAPLTEFVIWLVAANLTTGLNRRALWHAYGEFCLDSNTTQLTEGQFLRRIRGVGVQRYREPVAPRRWFYRVDPELIDRLTMEQVESLLESLRIAGRDPPNKD